MRSATTTHPDAHRYLEAVEWAEGCGFDSQHPDHDLAVEAASRAARSSAAQISESRIAR